MKIDVVYFKDSRKMSEIEADSITLILTSPPYWNIKDYLANVFQEGQNYPKIEGQIGDIADYSDYLAALTEVWKECERVLKPNGKLCINAPLMPIPKHRSGKSHLRIIKNIYSDIEHCVLTETRLNLMDVYIWDRPNSVKKLMFGSYPYPPNFYAQNTIEFIGVFVKEGKPERKDAKVKELSRLTKEEWITFTKQVWTINIPNKGDEGWGFHPAIMPLEIAKRLIRLFSFVGDIVLDPFLGSGTTAKAARILGRHFIGYEINPAFKPIIARKIGQLSLFDFKKQ